MSLRVIRRALPRKAAFAVPAIAAGALIFGAAPALAAGVGPITSTSLTGTATASAPGAGSPAAINIKLSTPSSADLVAPASLSVSLPADFSANLQLAAKLVTSFGGVAPGSGTYIALSPTAAPAADQSVGTATIVSSALKTLSPNLPTTLTGKVYVLSNDPEGTYSVAGLDLGTEIQFPAKALGGYLDVVANVDEASGGGVIIDFADLVFDSNPIAFSSFSIGMPASTSVSVTPKCGKVDPVDVSGVDAVTSAPFTSFSLPVSVTCPAKVSKGTVSGIKSGKPSFGFTATANGGDFSALTVGLPSGVTFTKSAGKYVSVSGAKVASKKVSGKSKLAITLKAPAKSAKVKISAKAFKISPALLKKIEKKKVKSLTLKVYSVGGSSSVKIKV